VTAEIFRGRDANSLLLVLWIAGTFYFAACCNWTVNARSILPMTPAVAILVARRLQSKNVPGHIIWPAGVIAALLAGGALTMLVARADFSAACAVRQCAQEVRARHSDRTIAQINANGSERFHAASISGKMKTNGNTLSGINSQSTAAKTRQSSTMNHARLHSPRSNGGREACA